MINNLVVKHCNDSATFRVFVNNGNYTYLAEYNLIDLFDNKKYTFHCQSVKELSEKEIKEKIISYHLDRILNK
jgi:hypothetical protein